MVESSVEKANQLPGFIANSTMCSCQDKSDVNRTPKYLAALTCCSGVPALAKRGGGATEQVRLRETSMKWHLSAFSFKNLTCSTQVVMAVMSANVEIKTAMTIVL